MSNALPLFPVVASTAEAACARQAAHTSLSPEACAAMLATCIGRSKGRSILSLPKLAPALYREIDGCLKTIGIIWSRREKLHLADTNSIRLFFEAAHRGSYVDTIDVLEYFPTSSEYAATLAQRLAAELEWMDAPHILEPSAGDGIMVAAILDAIPHATVTAVELDPKRCRDLERRFEGDPRVRSFAASIFDDAPFTDVHYDGALMNPPFSNALGHIDRVDALLRPGGWMVGIAPYGASTRSLAVALHRRDADLEHTPRLAFSTTSVSAISFSYRTGKSYYMALADALATVPGTTAALINEVERASLTLHRLAEDDCNGTNAANYDQRYDTCVAMLREWLTPLGIDFVLKGDPRSGHGIALAIPGIIGNDADRHIIVPNAFDEARDIWPAP